MEYFQLKFCKCGCFAVVQNLVYDVLLGIMTTNIFMKFVAGLFKVREKTRLTTAITAKIDEKIVFYILPFSCGVYYKAIV